MKNYENISKVKIGFHWPRTNAFAENKNIFAPLRSESELQGIDLYKICSTFERVVKRIVKKKIKSTPQRVVKRIVKKKIKSTPPGVNDVIFIYALIDPRDFQVRYIGKTKDIKGRLRAHIFPHNDVKDKNIKMIWTEELKSLGLKPIMTVLTSCSEEESVDYEYMYYKLFKGSCDLLNSAVILKETFQMDIKYDKIN